MSSLISNSKNGETIGKSLESEKSCKEELLRKREKMIGSKCQLFFKDNPLVVSKAFMQYIYDENGHKYIDCISNVQHVGHCNSAVNEAIVQQLSKSTCNSRFVSEVLTDCAEEILKTIPSLDTIIFCNSGSEANDLALQLARDYTKHTDAIVLDHAYHGHVTTTMQMSPYKFRINGSSVEKPDWVHVVPCPDVYRGKHRLSDEDMNDVDSLIKVGKLYSDEIRSTIAEAKTNGRKIGAFFAESLQSCGGQIIPPPNYFSEVAKIINGEGGLVVIDEVQTGFGRVGSEFWAHKLYKDFQPDIVTIGKPMGNGFPVAAIITKKKIADSLGGTVGYFNTYGGNPVACAVTLAVIREIHSRDLMKHAQQMGKIFEREAVALKTFECIGDIRGTGMFWGLDIVKNRKSREPDGDLANALIYKLRNDYRILLSTDGPFSNIIKIKPPMCLTEDDLIETNFEMITGSNLSTEPELQVLRSIEKALKELLEK